MKYDQYIQAISGLLFFGMSTIILIFINFVLRRGHSAIFGIPIPASKVHIVLGPLLVLINAALFVYLCAFVSTTLTPHQILRVQSYQPKFLLGPILNPYFLGKTVFLNNIGMAFLIVLWWLGMHSFIYSLELEQFSPLRFGWQSLISVLYLSLGLASIIAIQMCWIKWGFGSYKDKWLFSFFGIAIGAFGPPYLLKLGIPKIL